jgi:thioredoxin reductase
MDYDAIIIGSGFGGSSASQAKCIRLFLKAAVTATLYGFF